MSQLGHTYRFVVENKTGQTLAANAVQVFARRWKTDDTFEAAEATVLNNGSTIATSAFFGGGTIDNSTDKYFSGHFIFSVTAPASSAGDVVLYVQVSTDGGTRWPDNANYAQRVAILNFTTSGTKSRNFSL